MKLFFRGFVVFIFILFVFLFPSNVSAVELPSGSVWEWMNATTSVVQKQGLSNIISTSVGYGHNLALKSDGTVWAWGLNQHGQLGIGTISATVVNPVQVKSPDGLGYLTDIKEIAAGKYYSMALKNDDTVWIWGYNGDGIRGTRIGINDSSSKLLFPTQVKEGFGVPSSIISIAAGEYHTLALRSDGIVFAWGNNSQGQVKTYCYFSTCGDLVRFPVEISNDTKSIAAGSYHSLIVKTNGTVWGWGSFSGGQLGSFNGDYVEQGSPVQIPNINGIKNVWANHTLSVALSQDGKVFEWGGGRYLPYDADPNRIPDLQNVVSVVGNGAVKEDGTVWVWDFKDLTSKQIMNLSNIDSISMDFSSQPNLAVVKIPDEIPTPAPTETPAPTPTLTPTPTPKTPLIIIPGIMGSEFKSDQTFTSSIKDCGILPAFTYNTNDVVWVNTLKAAVSSCDDYFDVLKLKVDGQTPEYSQIVLSNTLFEGAYGNTIKFFTDNGYALDKDFFLFPYDWRRDIVLTVPLLDQKINDIRAQTGSQKVDITAHSMGGLVARNYISDFAKAQNVRKLFTLGTPHLGSVDFLKNLRFGGCFLYELGPFCFSIARSEVKDILQNLISGYELAPSQEYFNFYNNQDVKHPYPYSYNSQPLNYDQIKSFLTNLNYNTDLFNPSESFHALDNKFTNTNGVEVTNIVGSGLKTLGQIREKRVKIFLGNTVHKKDRVLINGDKTVPLFSASLIDHSNNKSLLGNAKVFYTKQNHGELIASGSALNLVKNILEGNSYLPDGAYIYPYAFSGTQISVHSPVNISVYDSADRHTGPTHDGNFEENIPGSSYDILDDAKFIFLPNDGNYRIELESTGQGSFDFKIRKYENDALSHEVLYKDISLTRSAVGETQLDTYSDQFPIIHLDEDGDGTIDQNINPSSSLMGDAVYDDVAPSTDFQIYGTIGKNGWFKSDAVVTLIVQDDSSGSGILKTEYSLDNGQTVSIYNKPFTISAEKINKLKFRSVDNAGNEEDVQEIEIKIDKTAPEAKIFVDQNKQDLVVTGVDANLTVAVKSNNALTEKKDDAFYLITDEAGNSLELDVREVDRNKQDRFRIYSIQYNEDTPIVLDNNHFNVIYNGKKERANIKEQNFELKEEIGIRIKYDIKRDKSVIIVKESKQERVKDVRSGLVYLNLLTDKGQLGASY